MTTDREVHPVAALFPMLANDELDELAADIAERGLLHPVVLDAEGRVLDGRNRLAACERAGVEPAFVTYDGDDPDGYALAVNVQRRNLTKGQQAMIIAAAGDNHYRDSEVSRQYVSWARTVLKYADGHRHAVIAGAMPLREAYETALDSKRKSEGREAQLAALRAADPVLADKVVEGELTLAGAFAEQKARAAQRESERRAGIANLRSVLTYLVSTSIPPADLAADYADVLDEFKRDDLDYAAETMTAIAALKEGN